jgi:stage V sporulation protein AD
MQQLTLQKLAEKAGMEPKQFDLVFSGDLLNQCIGSSFTLRNTGIPHLGLYGACSTMAESLLLASMTVGGGFADRVAAMTSSHFAASERQYRFPLGYGGQRTPTSQWTVTGSGAALICAEGNGPRIKACTIGTIVDLGIKDANNMGAAMAPAAIDTLTALFADTKTNPSDYDAIFTGDLGLVGSRLLHELLKNDGIDIIPCHNDCGLMIFDRNSQDVHAGGSGCGCCASVMCGHILNRMEKGELRRILICATGALLSPTSSLQGEAIPAIAHVAEICM